MCRTGRLLVLINVLDKLLESRGRISSPVRKRLSDILSTLDTCSPSEPIFAEALFAKLEAKGIASAEKYSDGLDELVRRAAVITGLRKDILDRIEGYLPPAEVIIDFVESQVSGEKISGATLWEANQICRRYVQKGTNPRFEHFIRDALSTHIQPDELILMTITDMVSFLKDEYDPFAKRVANGLISRAGKLNEMLLERALVNEGVGEKGVAYDVTGTKSQGDIVFYCQNTKPQSQLYAEVKSYGARERLLRGLSDLAGKDCIGVGFFTDASEFNPTRTQDFINTGTQAVYMPDQTFLELHSDSTKRVSKHNKPFYRKLTSFPSDILNFVRTGQLP